MEFNDFIHDSGIISEHFVAREVNIQFSLAMMTQVDEIQSMRHMHMTEKEFIEALSRVADKLAIQNTYPSVFIVYIYILLGGGGGDNK